LFCYLSLANIAPWQTSSTFAQLLAILRVMRGRLLGGHVAQVATYRVVRHAHSMPVRLFRSAHTAGWNQRRCQPPDADEPDTRDDPRGPVQTEHGPGDPPGAGVHPGFTEPSTLPAVARSRGAWPFALQNPQNTAPSSFIVGSWWSRYH